ncbi:Histone deacetylase complex subunit SAP18 [Trametes pubescens]|uniref:Histone deacetylase complex subunit SAP18 n=1 Tax=Trametes pubescens TaxID=154538 RepID=A0A1M2W6R0_TRAPU|nr:Histone deacetylase complex subunit SAP18 [Trametes pubescens]
MEGTTPAGKPIVDREKTAPFLIRTFIKIGTFHRLQQFEDGPVPIADEQEIYTWKDATLREVLTSLRSSAPNSPEYRHPLARYSFRAVFADAAARGRFSQKELGTVYSRDILGEPGALNQTAPRLLEDTEAESSQNAEQDRTLDELRFVPGDYLCVAVHLPKGVTVPTGPGGELAIKGSAINAGPAAGAPNGWKGAGGGVRGDGGWGGNLSAAPGPGLGLGRGGGGGHWRGNSGPEAAVPRGARGGRGGGDFGGGRDRDDRRVPPARRDEPPRREGWGRRGVSRSRSPPRRRGRYD